MAGLDDVTEPVKGIAIQGRTVTLSAIVGDLVIRISDGGSGSCTGAERIHLNSLNPIIAVYKTTSTAPTFTGAGVASWIFHYKNSKKITNAITGFDDANAWTNAVLPNAKKGDLVITSNDGENYSSWNDCLEIGTLIQDGTNRGHLYKCLSANAKLYYGSGNRFMTIVHLS